MPCVQGDSWLRAASSAPTLLSETGSLRPADFEQKSEDDKMKLRHYKKATRLKEEERIAVILQKAIALNRQRLMEQAEGAVAMRKKLSDHCATSHGV